MKRNKLFLFAILPILASLSLVSCGSQQEPDEDEEIVYEIGDTVKEWVSSKDFDKAPLNVPEETQGSVVISENDGKDDDDFLECTITGSYIGSDALEKPYFTNNDAKNGDIISLYFYLPENHNVKSLQLEALTISNFIQSQWSGSSGESFKGDLVQVSEEKEAKWIRTLVSYDTLETLGAIRLNITRDDTTKPAHFYVDNINITFGAETVKTGYEYKNESLYKAFKDYFKVGTCMSASYERNTMMRKIIVDNFNSVTAENEGKPDSTLDQAACQELAKKDEKAVAISTSAFEKIYDWCEAHHIQVRHHTFVWHQQTPDWFFKKGYASGGQNVDREVMLGRLENFLRVTIETLDERWPGLVYALDIVNEAIEEVGQIRSGNWMNTVGEDYIYQAFVAANKYKMDYQEVYYNDYAFEQTQWGGVERCQWAVDTLLKKAIEEELIDGIGIQSHIEFSDVDTVLEDARIICKAGIKCQITELDINCNGESEFEQQKDAYYKIVKSILEGNDDGTMNVNAIIIWGITDNTSWHSNRSPLMFDSNYTKKPAYYGFLKALEDFEYGE